MIAARCNVCGGPAVSDCCGRGEVIVVETLQGAEIVCSACFSTVECCIEPGCDGMIVPVARDGAR